MALLLSSYSQDDYYTMTLTNSNDATISIIELNCYLSVNSKAVLYNGLEYYQTIAPNESDTISLRTNLVSYAPVMLTIYYIDSQSYTESNTMILSITDDLIITFTGAPNNPSDNTFTILEEVELQDNV